MVVAIPEVLIILMMCLEMNRDVQETPMNE